MDQSKNTSSKLDALFENARKEQPLMDLNEVSNLIKNPSAYQKKKESNVMRWFGVFLLIGLGASGMFFLINNNSSDDKKTGNAVAVSNPSSIQASIPETDKTGETSVSANNNNLKNTAIESTLAGKNEKEKNATTGKSAEPVLSSENAKSNPVSGIKHYTGNATISFSSDNKKIKMTISPANEIEELLINEELIANESYKDYKSIIDEGLKLKNEKIKTGGGGSVEEQSLNAEKRTIMNEMMKELSSDGLITSDQPFDFTLTGQELILDKQKQSQETFERYKGVYEKVTGEKLPSKYNLHIKR